MSIVSVEHLCRCKRQRTRLSKTSAPEMPSDIAKPESGKRQAGAAMWSITVSSHKGSNLFRIKKIDTDFFKKNQ